MQLLFSDFFDISVYQEALAQCKTEEDKAHIWTALGMVAYQAQDIDGAKTALFNW